MISFDVSPEDRKVIERIADRVRQLVPQHSRTKPDWMMDVTAVHANGTPLKLEELAAAPNFDFTHDMMGIMRHLNRETGQLEDFFLPRFAQKQIEEEA